MMHLSRTLALAPVLCPLALHSCSSSALPPHPEPAETSEARREQDLDYLVQVIDSVHPRPFLRRSEADFRTDVEGVRRSIPGSSEAAFTLALVGLLASLEDAHCGLDLGPAWPIASPLRIERFEEGYFVVGAAEGHEDLVGARVVSINGRSYPSLLEELDAIVPAANPHRVVYRAERHLMVPRTLHALGLGEHEDRLAVVLEPPGGEEVTRVFSSDSEPDFARGHHVLSDAEECDATIFRQPHETGAPYWWRVYPEERLAYLQYNQVQTHPDYPFDAMVDEFLARIGRDDVDHVAIDLRFNGGGNNSLIDPLDDGLAALVREGGIEQLFVLTCERTFSSGVDVAVRLRANAGATVVGSPTGGMPNSFGNAIEFTLPNSGTVGRCSTGYFRITEGEPSTLTPDVSVERSFSDYRRGRDTLMAWIRARAAGSR